MIGQLLEHYGVKTYRTRGAGTVLCPLHDDHIKSMSIDYDKDLFFCHACGLGGNHLTLIMEMDHCDFKEAIYIAEGIFGVGDSGLRGEPERGRSALPKGQGHLFGGSGRLPAGSRRR